MPGFRRRGPKRASNVEEKNLIEDAKELAEDPMKVLPRCESSCFVCKYWRDKRKLKKIEKHKDNEKKLKKYAKRGPDLSKAVAGTLLLALQEEAPLLATADTPQGSIAFAKRGKASKQRLIGIQHFQDPSLRLLAYSKEAKKGYHFYSWDDEVVCTGKDDDPPEEFIQKTLNDLPYRLKGDDKLSCSHLDKRTFFTLTWKGAEKKISICEDCAKKKENLFLSMSKGMMYDDIPSSFTLKAKYRIDCMSDCDNCRWDEDIGVPSDIKDDYFSTNISDSKLLSRYERKAWDTLKSRGKVFATPDACFGRDLRAFMDSLRYEEWEEPGIRAVLENTDGLLVEDRTVNTILGEEWSSSGKKALEAVTGDEDMAQRIYDETEEGVDSGDVRPREVLKMAKLESQKKEKLEALPEFTELPPKAEFAHEVVKIYKTRGTEAAVNYMDDQNITDTRMKSLEYAFLNYLGKGGSKRWKYEESEIESGEFMTEYVENLMDREGEEYAESLQELLKASGSTRDVKVK